MSDTKEKVMNAASDAIDSAAAMENGVAVVQKPFNYKRFFFWTLVAPAALGAAFFAGRHLSVNIVQSV